MPSRLVLLALSLAFVAARAAEDTPITGLYGQIAGNIYIAPGGTYSVPIPVLPELGGQVHDTENVVTFDDTLSTHASIACFAQDVSQKWEFDSRGTREYLTYFYATFVLPDFQSRFPGASAETTLFVPNFLNGSLLGFVLLPGGSFFEGRDSIMGPATGTPAVAKRGNLLFVKSGFVYVLSMELAERITQASVFHKTPAEEDAILRDRLMQLAGRIHFAAPKTPRPEGNE